MKPVIIPGQRSDQGSRNEFALRPSLEIMPLGKAMQILLVASESQFASGKEYSIIVH